MNKKNRKFIKRFSSRKFMPLYDYYFPIKKMKVKDREREREGERYGKFLDNRNCLSVKNWKI